jgi:glucoamylase
MVLAASEDKTHRGASIASPSMPWAWGKLTVEPDEPSGPYHLVWARDLYQVSTAQIAAGDRDAARRNLDFLLFEQQKPDGSFPQNSFADGRERSTELQLDQVAFPLVLAWQLDAADARRWARLKRAADFLVRTGPRTGQERWENQAGWSPATIAAEVAGLVCAADLARRNGDPASATRYERTADVWAAQVERWTATTNGPWSDQAYYLRVTKARDPNRATTYNVGDSGFEAVDQRREVDPSFLELVRLGVRRADDPVVRNTLAVVDAKLRVLTPNGPFWHRFTSDGYGEETDGDPWDVNDPGTFRTFGRLWPIFAGERGEYELLAGRPATGFLDAMAATANDGGMIPEQVWDGRPPTGVGGRAAGEGTQSATPLAWSHAQLIRLAWSIDAGRPVEQPSIVAARYAR